MASSSLFHFQTAGRNWKAEEQPPQTPLSAGPEVGESEHTVLEREVADIIISLLYQQGSGSGRRFRRRGPQRVPTDFCFPRWTVKRRRSLHAPSRVLPAHGGGGTGDPLSISSSNTLLPSSPSSACKENSGDPFSLQVSSNCCFADEEPQAAAQGFGHGCPDAVEVYFRRQVTERGLLFWPGWGGGGGREYAVPDLNISAEELVAATADAEFRRRQRELYERACRRMAAADARRRRRELQKLKSSIAAGPAFCSRVR